MAAQESSAHGDIPRSPEFVTTHWSVVLTAGSHQDNTRAREALAGLCRTYWYPLYAYVRRRGYNAHDAQDLTQAFFEQLLKRRSLASVDPERGRFRTFILTAMNYFLVNEWKKVSAQKRGGGDPEISLDRAAAEQRFDLEPATTVAPDRLFEKQWALTLLSEVLSRLEREYESEGKEELFNALKETLMGHRESQPYTDIARTLGMNENAVKVAVHRLRRRYRELIHAEIANTLDPSEDVEAEMRYLYQVLAS
jgi:RNA polymerase sigma factor, sigma-70 family